jgi:cytochrome c553
VLVEEAGGCCAVCGYDRCLVNLHFHHVNPATKSFAISVASGKSIAAYREEAKKCVLVCANCHGEIETGMIESPPPSGVVCSQAPLPDSAQATISIS